MRETVSLNGVVLYAQPVGEYDKRLVILTGERGKITVFAHGVRRMKSPLIAAANPFVFASFSMYEGRDAYTLVRADVIEYFAELASMLPETFYGYYFLELASYYGREGMEARDAVNLIYVSLMALLRQKMDTRLIRRVFELRMLAVSGEFAVPGAEEIPDAAAYEAVRYSVSAPLTKLYSFCLAENSGEVFSAYVRKVMRRTVDKTFKSLAVIEEMR